MIRTKLLVLSTLAMAAAGFSQQPAPQTPEDAFTSRDLIAWSHLQTPQPMPQPLPARDNDNTVPQPGQTPDQQAKPPADPHRQQEPSRWFSGKIVKDGDIYVLQVTGDMGYRLECEIDPGRYESRNVTVYGGLNDGHNTIHATTIRLLS